MTSDGPALNPRCRDILSDARKATQDALGIVDVILNEHEEDQSLVTAVRNHFQQHLKHIDNLQDECMDLDHNGDNHARKAFHGLRMEHLVGAPFRRSAELVLLQSYVNQQTMSEVHQEAEFARLLIHSMMNDLEIELVPLVVFSDHYQFLDLKSHFLIAIPFAYLHRYDRWWALAHEIGHGFYNRNKDIDTDELLKLLAKSIPEEVMKEYEANTSEMLLMWVRNWLPELIADLVAISLFGMYYLVEVRHIDTVEFGIGGVTHPPLSFRFSCLRHILKQKGIDVDKLGEIFDKPTKPWRDPVLNALLGERLAPIFIEWVLKQPLYARLEFRWDEILKMPLGSRPSSIYSAICMKSYETDTSNEFSLLKKNLQEKKLI